MKENTDRDSTDKKTPGPDMKTPDEDMVKPPDFFRPDNPDNDMADSGTLLLSELEAEEQKGAGGPAAAKDALPEDIFPKDAFIDPDATTLRDLKKAQNSPESGVGKKKDLSFDNGTVFAPGGDLDAINLEDIVSGDDVSGDIFRDSDNIADAETIVMRDGPFGKQNSESVPEKTDEPSFLSDMPDILSSGDELDFDFVSREDEGVLAEEDEDREEDIDKDARTVFAPVPGNFDRNLKSEQPENAAEESDNSGIAMFHPDAETLIDTEDENITDNMILSPDDSEILSPDDSEILSPDDSEILSPDGSELLSPDDSELLSPDDSELLSPDDSEILSPDDSELLSPDADNMPDQPDTEKEKIRNIEKNIEDATVFNFTESSAAVSPESAIPEQHSVKNDRETMEEDSFRDASTIIVSEAEFRDTDLADTDKEDFRDAQTLIAAEADIAKEGKTEQSAPENEEDIIFELGEDAIIELDEDEIVLDADDIITDTKTPDPGTEEDIYDPNAETVIAPASAPADPGSGERERAEKDSVISLAEADERAGEDTILLPADETEELPDLDSITGDSDTDETIPDFSRQSDETESTASDDSDITDIQSILNELKAADLSNTRQKKDSAADRGDDTIGLLNAMEEEIGQQGPEEDDFFTLPDMDSKTEPPSPPDNFSANIKKEKKEIAPEIPSEAVADNAADDMPPEIKTGSAEKEVESEDSAEKHYFSVSPGQIESAIERVINRIFTERIEAVVKEVIEKAVEEEMKKIRDLFIEEVPGGQ
ncbi:MAG: hypothetical protein V2I97_04150 [Desulfococcaceae bacterium]|jgi:hypothetical protein|nr:hypothetical protein [Desulfococcaceae bacterium]